MPKDRANCFQNGANLVARSREHYECALKILAKSEFIFLLWIFPQFRLLYAGRKNLYVLN